MAPLSMASLENLRQILDSIQDVQDNKKVIETLQIAKKALHEEVKDQDVDKIQDLVDDIKTLVEKTEDISEALNSKSDLNDDSSLEIELEKLLQEEKDKELDLALANLTVNGNDPIENDDKAKPKKELEASMEAVM